MWIDIAVHGLMGSQIGRDPLLRQLRNQLRGALSSEYATGGALTALAQAGIELTRTGSLELNETRFDEALADGTAGLAALFTGSTGNPGVFAGLDVCSMATPRATASCPARASS